MLTGWGKISEGGPWSRYLRKVRIPIVADQECDNNVRIERKKVREMDIYLMFQVFHYSLGPQNIFSLSPNQLCAGDRVDKKGPCQVGWERR